MRWFRVVDGLAVLYWPGGDDLHCSLLTMAHPLSGESNEGFVAVEWGVTFVVDCYFSPNRGLTMRYTCTGWGIASAVTPSVRYSLSD